MRNAHINRRKALEMDGKLRRIGRGWIDRLFALTEAAVARTTLAGSVIENAAFALCVRYGIGR